jgi:ribonuclease BN (tRNA processing enzyme)
MVELGNGDVFLFDIGTGSMENLFGLRPDFSRIDKVFLSHLHSDHFGDLFAAIHRSRQRLAHHLAQRIRITSMCSGPTRSTLLSTTMSAKAICRIFSAFSASFSPCVKTVSASMVQVMLRN